MKVMIIDGLNMFLRSYIIIPSMDPRGNPNGGTWGFLKSLQKICKKFNPDEIVVCWDGVGGSEKKRTINKNYKQGRKPLRFNRRMIELSVEKQEENKAFQQIRLMDYLNDMPVIQTMIDYVEADDVIAYVAQHERYKEWGKVIVSSDKDFLQLVEGNCSLYRPIQDTVLEQKNILEEYGIHPRNFALARALVGDKSDNLPGVGSIGLATVKKRFPFLSEERSYSLKEIIDYSANVDTNLKAYQNVVENSDVLEKNYKMMQLYSPFLSPKAKKLTRDAVQDPEITFNKTEITKMMIQDGFGEYNWNSLFQIFNRIVLDNKNE